LALNATSATTDNINTRTSNVTAMNINRCCSAIGLVLDSFLSSCVLSENEKIDVVIEKGSSWLFSSRYHCTSILAPLIVALDVGCYVQVAKNNEIRNSLIYAV